MQWSFCKKKFSSQNIWTLSKMHTLCRSHFRFWTLNIVCSTCCIIALPGFHDIKSIKTLKHSSYEPQLCYSIVYLMFRWVTKKVAICMSNSTFQGPDAMQFCKLSRNWTQDCVLLCIIEMMICTTPLRNKLLCQLFRAHR